MDNTKSSKENKRIIQFEGIVEECLKAAEFQVTIKDQTGSPGKVIAYTAGSMRRHKVRIVRGDRVLVEITAGLKHSGVLHGRIVKRFPNAVREERVEEKSNEEQI